MFMAKRVLANVLVAAVGVLLRLIVRLSIDEEQTADSGASGIALRSTP
jgi:hypothetical protein